MKIFKSFICISFFMCFLTGCAKEKEASQYELGLAYYKAKEFKKAEVVLKNAIRINEKDPRAHNALGLVYEKEGMFENAKKAFQEALRVDKKFKEAKVNLAGIEEAKSDYALYRFAADFLYTLSKEYSNGNNAFLKGVQESMPVKDESGKIAGYEVSLDVYLAREYFDKCSRVLEDIADRTATKSMMDIIDTFSLATQQRQEAIDLQLAGYSMGETYSGEFEKACAKVRIADSYYIDAAGKLQRLMSGRPSLFSEKELASLRDFIGYYSQEKKDKIELSK